MKLSDWNRGPLRAADAGGAAAGAGDGGDAGAAAAAAAAAESAAGGGGGDEKPGKWFEDPRFGEHKDWLGGKGMTVDDPLDALDRATKGWRAAERHLGKPADSLMAKPDKGGDLTEWMRQQGEVFGLPDAPEKYEFDKPAMPEGIKWDEAFEQKARAVAFENGVPPKTLDAFVKAYAEHTSGIYEDAGAQLQAANTEMLAKLETDWGAQTEAKMAQARQAAAMLGEQAGLDSEQLASIALALKPRVGDAGTIKLFAAIGDMLGEDTLKTAGSETARLGGATPAEARAQLAAMDAPEGEFGRAYHKGNRAEMERLKPKREALLRVASQG